MMQEMGISTTDASADPSIQVPIHLWFTAPELGHPLIDDNHETLLHPLVGPFLRDYLFRFESMDDDDDEMGHLMMMIAFITIKRNLVPLIEGLCAQIYFRFEISVVCSHLLLFFFVKEKIR